MSGARRSTLIVDGKLAMREARLAAAIGSMHGLQIMSFEQAAVRLAGGLCRPIDDEALRLSIQSALRVAPMGELESIKALPGMVAAAAGTLQKAWRAGIDLKARSKDHPRLEALARLEAAVLEQLPPVMIRPIDIAAIAVARVCHAPALLGPIEICGLTEISLCWRPLLHSLSACVPVVWNAGPRPVPDWLTSTRVAISRSPAETPEISAVSAATPYHEVIEAMRWARSLLASGVAPAEIAIASASTADYDDHFLALRADANIDLHFVHGIRTVATRDGQTAAALADIVVRGLSQARLRRLAGACRGAGAFQTLPDGWIRILPPDAPLSTSESQNRFLSRLRPEDWPDGSDHTPALRSAIDILTLGSSQARDIGEAFLSGRSLAIWRRALHSGPAGSIDSTLEMLKQDDGLEACACVAWMPAGLLATSPRPFVRLLGLNSTSWPRGISEDRLIPDRIIPMRELDPLPVNSADRRDFEAILVTTKNQVVLSRARRSSDGRLLGRSSLLNDYREENYLRRNEVPEHAFSQTDRIMARPEEFASDLQAVAASSCWRNWRLPNITAHDGLIRADHPLVLAVLARTQSASSLRRLLRNPLSFLWLYAFGWREPKGTTEPLVLDPLEVGDLVHAILERALRDIEDAGGLASAANDQLQSAVRRASEVVAADWESERAVPPAVIWHRTLDDVRILAGHALSDRDDDLSGARSYGEVPFGGSVPKFDAIQPWDPTLPVTIPGTEFRIAGYIDRLDVSNDGKRAFVRDYKTGRPPSGDIRLNGGRELQRCLYAFAVKALLGRDIEIGASLMYPREKLQLRLENPEAVLSELTGYLREARISLACGAGAMAGSW